VHVVALLALVLLADGTAPGGVPALPAAPGGASSWLSPEGLNAVLALLLVVAPLLGALLGKQSQAAKVTHYATLAKGYMATVKGVQSFRDLAKPEEASKLLAMIQSAASAAGPGVAEAHHAAVHAITEGVAPMPVTVPGVQEKVTTSDPLAAVRAATARLGVRRVS
jgi:hypothetical protein